MVPSQDRDIDIRRQGRAGRITLQRPQALNALTHDMALEVEAALLEWRNDNDIALIIIDAEGDRAFCAGGDIEKLYQTGKAGNFDYGRTFWTDEYRLNALIANYPKPYIAFMQGYVMGGGVGISCHGSHRIVCESTRIAMPECEIGLVPDVGGSYLLANAPGRLGEFLAMTGTRMKAADAIHCGFADSFIPQENWEELKSRLCDTGEIGAVADLTIDPGPSELAQLGNEVDPIFASGSALQCLQTLEMETETWAAAAVKSIRRGCPLSVACAHELVGMSRKVDNIRTALDLELRFTWRSMSHGEFIEGVRALIIDKDRKPNWRTPRLEEVTDTQIAEMLAPLPELESASIS